VRILKADFGWMLISFNRCGATEAQHVGLPIKANATLLVLITVLYFSETIHSIVGDQMLSTKDALVLLHHHLGTSARALHSQVVAYLMRELAQLYKADPQLWELVGLCHDLDYFATEDDGRQHGLLTFAWLQHDLPEEALEAIAAHDYRTGVTTDTLLADMLKVADVVTVLDERLGRAALLRLLNDDGYTVLRATLGERVYLSDILEQYAAKHRLSLDHFAQILAGAPSQAS
jgi:predicted hydrolase (HD superfamily)